MKPNDPSPYPFEASRTAYHALVVVVLGASSALCIVAAQLGRSKFGEGTYYFYELGDVGHPGVVNMVTAMGFVGAAIVCATLATGRVGSPRPWIVASALFVTVAFDDLLRLHNQVRGADVFARAIYWIVLVVLAMRLRPIIWRRRGTRTLILAFALLAASEIIDLLTPGDNPHYRHHQLLSVIEESTACIGACALAVAAVGVAGSLLGARHHDVVDEEPATSVSLGL